MTDHSAFTYVCQNAQQAALLHSSADALEWDERTNMPVSAGDYRADQVSYLRGLAHQRRTEQKYRDYLEELFQKIDPVKEQDHTSITIMQLHRDLQRDIKLSTALVERSAKLTVKGQQVWDTARKNNCFDHFKSILSEIVSLKREIGDRLREETERTRYEALIDEYEPEATVKQIDELFSQLRRPLVALIKEVQASGNRPKRELFQQALPVSIQRQLSRDVAVAIGFDFNRGRLDETSHPFCTTLGPHDCRILTRYDPQDLGTGLFGTMHEAGHGMYEQGLNTEAFGLPAGSYCSLGIHESQSRMWENQVGRSQSFWKWITPKLKDWFPDQYAQATAEELYFAANDVYPSLIRVEADEATYNLHIIIRYDIEKKLIEGSLDVNEVQDEWNARYHADLGVEVDHERNGVLQDVHWSAGLFGYFPTYTIGNLIAAQLFYSAQETIPALDQKISEGSFDELLQWTRDTVHQHGRSLNSEQIVQKSTGMLLSPEYLVQYLREKLESLYEL